MTNGDNWKGMGRLCEKWDILVPNGDGEVWDQGKGFDGSLVM